MSTKSSDNNDGSTHHTRHDDGSHRSFDKSSDGSKHNDHTTDHSTGRTYYSQDTSDVGRGSQGSHKADDVTDKKGNNESRPSISDFHSKHDSSSSNDSNSDNSNSSSSGGGCFITTATLQSIGKSDNCIELNCFRNFRDNWLLNQPNGKEMISEYYVVAPKIVSVINSLPDSDKIYQDIWIGSILPCFKLINELSYSQATEIYCKVVKDLKSTYLSE